MRIKKMAWQTTLAYIVAALILLLVIIPFMVGIVSSFKVSSDFYGTNYRLFPETWRWENYIDAWEYIDYFKIMMNSAVCAVAVCIGSTLLSGLAAYGFARINFWGRDFIFYLFILTQGIPFVIVSIPTYAMFSQMGLVNTMAGLILPQMCFPMGTFILRQTMKSIPDDYAEAARIDGCGHWKMFFRIFFPMTKNSIISVGVLTFINCWNNYLWPLIITTNKENYTIPIGLTLFTITTSMNRPAWSVILAGAIISVLPIFVFYCFASRSFMEGITAGGIKG